MCIHRQQPPPTNNKNFWRCFSSRGDGQTIWKRKKRSTWCGCWPSSGAIEPVCSYTERIDPTSIEGAKRLDDSIVRIQCANRIQMIRHCMGHLFVFFFFSHRSRCVFFYRWIYKLIIGFAFFWQWLHFDISFYFWANCRKFNLFRFPSVIAGNRWFEGCVFKSLRRETWNDYSFFFSFIVYHTSLVVQLLLLLLWPVSIAQVACSSVAAIGLSQVLLLPQ